VQSWGLQLLDSAGRPFDARQLTPAHVIAFYFSASWCPPCQHFTPMLKKFVQTLESNGEHTLKVIFVSSDKTEHDMWKYMYDAHGDWLALAFSCVDGKDRLSRQYVSGIPQLVVIDQVGRQAVRDARGDVMGASNSSTQVLSTYLSWKSAAGACGSVPSAPQEHACSELPTGLRVRICGLTGTPELNGNEGSIQSFDASKQRYVVELGEKFLSLRAANLLQLVHVQVRHATNPDEWCNAGVVDFDAETCEVSVSNEESGSEPVRLRLGVPQGPVLKAGTRVVVQGLQAASAQPWNEKLGAVVEFDTEAERYLVQVAPETQLKVRPTNVRIFPLV